MSVCPKCNTTITEDFGLVDCSGCGVAVLIGIDGDVQVALSEETPPEILDSHSASSSGVLNSGSFAENVSELNDEATSFNFNVKESLPEEDDQFGFSNNESSSSAGEFSSFEESGKEEQSQLTNSQAIIDEFTSFGDVEVAEEEQGEDVPLESAEESSAYEEPMEEFNDEKTNFLADNEIAKAKEPVAQEELVDLSEYANSKKSSLKDGYLKYKLYIGGIDTNEIKKQVFEELADKKFLLDLPELNKKIVEGNLCIEPISAVKASILINRLKSISVTIAWDQYDIRKA